MLWALLCERVANVACQSHPDKRRSACNNTSPSICVSHLHTEYRGYHKTLQRVYVINKGWV